MNIRIALLVFGSLMAGGGSAAWADAMKPLDPDQAPIAAVDRFSDKADQDYLERVPHGYTCHFIRPDWKLPAREEAEEGGARAAE